MKKFRKYLIFVFAAIFLIYSLKSIIKKNEDVLIIEYLTKQSVIINITNCSKWIVLTTVNEPTDSVKYLRDSTFDWCFISIGYKKTNQNWTYKDIKFIDTSQQNELMKSKFNIIAKIPYDSYFRKIIGYLLAIEHKAEYIYEINDSNSAQDGLLSFKYETFNGVESTCNDYEESILDIKLAFEKCNKYSITNKYPIIQYSISNIDIEPSLSLNVEQYVIYGSDNTFYRYESFWSLVFPSQFKPNESIAIRAILTKRLLNEINSTISLMPSNSNNNFINKHDNSFLIYLNKLISNMNQWKCTKKLFVECFIDLIYYLVKIDLFNLKEIEFYKQWIKELNDLNYKWPELIKSNSNENFHNTLVYFNHNLKDRIDKPEKLIENFCSVKLNQSILFEKVDQIILITQAKNAKDLEYISLIQIYFAYIIVCFNNTNNIDLSIYSFTFILSNKSYSQCMDTAFKIGFKKESFLIVKQVLDFNYWNLKNSNLEKTSGLNSIDQNFYYIRRNVASGYAKLIIPQNDSICNHYNKSIQEDLTNLISKLNWHKNDLASEYCQNLNVKTIWIPDLHDGPRVDLSSTLIHLGQNPILAGLKYYSSPYPEVLALSKIMTDISQLSKTGIQLFTDGTDNNLIKENFNFYKPNKYFEQVDAVICSFPSAMCDCFIPLNQTLIFNPAHRYNLIRYSNKNWLKLNENYKVLKKKNKLILAAMSKYDWEYQFHFTGMKDLRLYAYGGYYAKNVNYIPIRQEILIGPTSHLGPFGKEMLDELTKSAVNSPLIFKTIRSIYSRYTLNNLANHKAIVIFPYAVMSYSIVDFYISKLPIFVPSIEMLTRRKNVADRTINLPYWKKKEKYINSSLNSNHFYDPNSDRDEDYAYWLQFADYYQWPFVTVFDSWSDLINKLQTINLTQISEKMEKFNKIREADLLTNWCKIIKRINKSPIPENFEKALKYFNITSILN